MNVMPVGYNQANAASVVYMILGNNGVAESGYQSSIARSGSLQCVSFYVAANTCDGNTVVTVRVNGVPTVLSQTVGAAATGFFVDFGPVPVVGGDLISFEVDCSGSTVGSVLISGGYVEHTPI